MNLEIVDRYVAEALKDPESRLYILLKRWSGYWNLHG